MELFIAECEGERDSLTYNMVKRYDTEILERLCKYFDCQVGDLIEYMEEGKE
jgi:DNA-binding Xre family transcriptional regulator